MRHWLYRIKKEDLEGLRSKDAIEIDYLPEPVEDGDMVAVFVSGDLTLLGGYRKEGKALWREKKEVEGRDLRTLYEKLSFIGHIGERTYKIFAKKVREITAEDYAVLTQ